MQVACIAKPSSIYQPPRDKFGNLAATSDNVVPFVVLWTTWIHAVENGGKPWILGIFLSYTFHFLEPWSENLYLKELSSAPAKKALFLG